MIMTSRRALLAGAALAGLAGCAHATADDPIDHYVAAYYYAYPIYEFARTAWVASAPNAQRPAHRYNVITHRRGLTDHTGRNVTTPNNDTIYSSARLDLTNGPLLAEFPTLHDRYFSIAFMNAYTDNFAYVGTRATHGEGGRALIVGPTWQGETPTGARLIRSQTDDVWLLARILVEGPSDLAAANAAQDGIRFIEVPEATLLPVAPTNSEDLANLIAVTNAMLARGPLTDPVGRRAANFADTGLRPGAADAWTTMSQAQRDHWTIAAARAQQVMRGGFTLRGETVNGWHYPPPGAGAPGDADDVRAAIALSGLAALEAVEATYTRADDDNHGEPLNGANRYTLTIPPNVPAGAFWSLSMYQLEPDGRLFFTENPIQRFAIGDRTPGLAPNVDGSITIALQREAPASTANWLPTPAGPFVVTFRFYLPEPPILNGTWRLAPVTRA
jgi:hypothetical protein